MPEDVIETQHRRAEALQYASPGLSKPQALTTAARQMNAAYRAKRAVDGIAEGRSKRTYVGFGKAR